MPSRVNALTASEVEELHERLATAFSLGDSPEVDRIIDDIFSRRNEDPLPHYASKTDERVLRDQIAADSLEVWDSIFSVIENGQIDALDRFVELGFDVNRRHPRRMQYPIYHAVSSFQTNMMRHLINLKADVNSWSAEWVSASGYQRNGLSPIGMVDPDRARTPLMCAAQQGNLNICKILCESAFADPMLIAADGQTAQRLAARNGHKEIVQYLPAHRGGSWRRLKCTSFTRSIVLI